MGQFYNDLKEAVRLAEMHGFTIQPDEKYPHKWVIELIDNPRIGMHDVDTISEIHAYLLGYDDAAKQNVQEKAAETPKTRVFWDRDQEVLYVFGRVNLVQGCYGYADSDLTLEQVVAKTHSDSDFMVEFKDFDTTKNWYFVTTEFHRQKLGVLIEADGTMYTKTGNFYAFFYDIKDDINFEIRSGINVTPLIL